MTLGRHPNCDIVLEVGAVSREHARVINVEDSFFLEDLKSRNGTFLNNDKLEGRRQLNEQDQIRICDLVFVFNHGTPEITFGNLSNGVVIPGPDELVQDFAPSDTNANDASYCVLPNTTESVSELCRRIHRSLQAHHVVFHPCFPRDPIISELQIPGSAATSILREGFHRVITLDAQKGSSWFGSFTADRFLKYMFTQLREIFNLPAVSPLHYHEEDVIQILKDEPQSLICLLHADVIPKKERPHIRALTLHRHQALILYQARTAATAQLPDDTDTVAAMLRDDELESNLGSSTIESCGNSRDSFPAGVNAETKLKAILQLMDTLGASIELDEVLPKILDGLFTIFVRADRGFIVLKDKDAGKFIPRATKYRRKDHETQIRISRTVIQKVTQEKTALITEDASQEFGTPSLVDVEIHSMMCVPLIGTGGEVLGVMQVDTSQLKNRFNENDLELMAAVARQAAVAVENAQLHEVAVREATIKQDLALASKIQRGFLPDKSPDVEGYEFFSYYYPARMIGGDFYDYIEMPDGCLAVVLADVAGKGIAASLIVAKLASEFKSCLISEPTPGAAIARMNNVFCHPRWEDRFVTALLMMLQPRSHQVCIVNAGHMAPLLRHADGTIEEIGQELAGLPLGVVEDTDYDPRTINLAIGDSLTAYTDGIPDARNVRDEFFGIPRLLTEMNARPFKSVDEMGRHIIDTVRQFAGSQTQTDDMCVSIIGRSKWSEN